ncbi:MAG: hypothetical protein HQM12_04315, partial [SAR324 cluster bacterium]|nr:hypothetical protein [SAR324 cluster bacterium]
MFKNHKMSIRWKLLIILMLAIWSVSFLNFIYVYVRTSSRILEALETKAVTIAEYAAFNSAPSMVFEDSAVLSEALSGL